MPAGDECREQSGCIGTWDKDFYRVAHPMQRHDTPLIEHRCNRVARVGIILSQDQESHAANPTGPLVNIATSIVSSPVNWASTLMGASQVPRDPSLTTGVECLVHLLPCATLARQVFLSSRTISDSPH